MNLEVKDLAFDDFPFIWKDLADKGYMTFAEEDWYPNWNLVHSGWNGYKEQPTDHYMRYLPVLKYMHNNYNIIK